MSSTTTQDLRPTAEAKLPDLIAILGTRSSTSVRRTSNGFCSPCSNALPPSIT